MGIVNTIEEKVNVPIEILKVSTQVGAGILLAFLPGQEYFDKHIPWYDAKIATQVSGMMETTGILLWPLAEDPIYQALILGSAIGGGMTRFGKKPEIPGQSDNKIIESKDHMGNFYLELIWRTGKSLYNQSKKITKYNSGFLL
jgi:hypothetical protein